MTIGVYIRVSTQEQAQEGYSISAQKERLIAFCGSQGWNDYKFYVDEGISAKDLNRPELKRMVDDAIKGKISIVLVYRLDRLTRRVKDLYSLLDIFKKYNCSFNSATEPYDTSSAMGKMFIGLVALLAEWETENLSERVKMALEEKVSSGERVGNIPYGFDLNENEKLVPNEKAVVVLDMINKYQSGMSASSLAAYLNKTNNDRVWYVKGVLRILRNPALYGATYWRDKVYENTHTGLITKQEFFKLQKMLEDNSLHHNRDITGSYLFQGKLICPTCESILTVNRFIRTKKDGSQYMGWCYKCNHCYKAGRKMLTIGEYRFEEALKEYMEGETLDDVNTVVQIEDDHALLMEQLNQIEKKREKYQRGWAADKITDDEFDKLMDETREIYDDLKSKLNRYSTPVGIDKDALEKMIIAFNENFTRLTQEEKKSFISQLIRRVHFKLIPQQPKRPDRNKKGKDKVSITKIEYYY